MTRPIIKMPSTQGLGKGQTASVDLPCGLSYFELLVRCTADVGAGAVDLTAADWATVFGDFRVMVNGNALMTMKADFAVARAEYHGETLQAGVLPIKLYQPWLLTEHDQDASAYRTANLSTFTLEMDILSGAPNVPTLLQVYARQGSFIPAAVAAGAKNAHLADNWGSHLEIHRYAKNIGVTGTSQITDLPRGKWGLVGLHLNTDATTRAQVFRNETKAFDLDPNIWDTVYKEAGRAPQTGWTHIDFCADNILREAIPMNASSFNVEYDLTATGNFSLYAETLKAA